MYRPIYQYQYLLHPNISVAPQKMAYGFAPFSSSRWFKSAPKNFLDYSWTQVFLSTTFYSTLDVLGIVHCPSTFSENHRELRFLSLQENAHTPSPLRQFTSSESGLKSMHVGVNSAVSKINASHRGAAAKPKPSSEPCLWTKCTKAFM